VGVCVCVYDGERGTERKRFEDVIYADTKIAAVVIWRTYSGFRYVTLSQFTRRRVHNSRI